MKILKEGVIQSPFIEAKCLTCSCEFEFWLNESKIIYSRSIKGVYHRTIECPNQSCKVNLRFTYDSEGKLEEMQNKINLHLHKGKAQKN